VAQQTKRNSRPSTAGTGSRSGAGSTNGPSGSAGRRSSSSTGSSRGSGASRSRSSKRPSSGSSKRSSKSRSTAGGSSLTDVAKKAKTPALAASAGLAGLAGGLAIAHRTTRKRIFGVPMPNGGAAHAVSKNLAEAAKNVGSFGEGMGSLAAEVRRVREGFAMAGEPKRSPIEVVLQGLTRRR
jgi:hypothetical protein